MRVERLQDITKKQAKAEGVKHKKNVTNKNTLTNADSIRSMTIKELVVIIMCLYNTEPGLCNRKTGCVDCCIEWLQSEVEE